ncbi:DUF3570 domain-containing protein [Methylococcus sp. EFPC2]|uniref:DUF3570 domain-containing protein n=1 Tax=Methylococcus sp. EFPC2 TaxID=2812648 RepID=UPI0019689507|nr:DUF3570 domain-containing protein [Methylococcus sp. EFPC2]QSA97034.1 DUF3570 domain-containing protein [Methylococcus sp. EFPC2]
MAAIKREKSAALAALTTAALGLPGMDAEAAVPVTQATGNVQYGYYQESDDRMKVEVYHGDFTLPVTDRLEFTFNVDRDTYSGATPAFSIPQTMTEQVRIKGAEEKRIDVISAASGGVTAQGLTTLGDLNSFKDVIPGLRGATNASDSYIDQTKASIEAQKQQEIAKYLAENPRPDFPATVSGAQTMTFGTRNADPMGNAVYGKANLNTGSGCDDPGTGGPAEACYAQGEFLMGTIRDPFNPNGHIHRYGNENINNIAQYHNDSAGIYIRALTGAAFNLKSLDFNSVSTPEEGSPGAFWEILGFNTAVNPNLYNGDGTNYLTRVAYQTVANNQSGLLTLNSLFQNVNAVWVHYQGFVRDALNNPVTKEYDFEARIDNINLDSAVFPDATPEQLAWLAAYNNFTKNLDSTYSAALSAVLAQAIPQAKEIYKQAVIKTYDNFLNRLVPPKTKTVQRFQTQPVETRTMPVFGAKYYFDNATLGFSGGQSNEPDFHSSFGSVNYSHELNNKLTTLTAGYGYTGNVITRSGAGHGSGHGEHSHDNPAIYPELKQNSDFHTFNLGLSQVMTKNTLLQLSANYTRQQGYLSNPYKFVYVRGEITPEEYYLLSEATAPGQINWNDITKLEVVGLELFREVRPDLRNQFSFSTRLNQYIQPLNAALHADYRFFIDDWGIDSHTLQLQWIQKLPWGLTATPSLRYYSQSKADFFAPYFLAPREDGHYSSDFRLSGYGALSGGLTLSKQFNRGIRLDLGVEYYTHQGDLKLGGGGESDYADFSYWMTNARLNIDLSAPGQMFGEGADDELHHHHHHGIHAPAGLMYAHMLDKAGDIMVGYRYMYGNQTGDMRHGDSRASDARVRGAACGSSLCSERPTEMSMQMHMLDLMYAPTDWLNLMLMPQLVDMKMKLEPLAGATGESEHGGGHETHGLGDTLMAAMVKVLDLSGHHFVHVGVGVSAPTGDVDATLDGREGGELQDYGMQLGSGTWDFKPSLTYLGHAGDWSWGAQVNATKRLDKRNNSGYVLGDQVQANAWGSYNFTPWLTASVRGVYTEQGKIRGELNRDHSHSAPVDFPSNYGGKFWDVGFGLNLAVPSGAFAGHQLSVEWLQPVADKFNGYQLEREGSLYANWNYAF